MTADDYIVRGNTALLDAIGKTIKKSVRRKKIPQKNTGLRKYYS